MHLAQLHKTKIGRNDPCHCGSGRKFKQCCHPQTDVRATRVRSVDMSVPGLLRAAIEHHDFGGLVQPPQARRTRSPSCHTADNEHASCGVRTLWGSGLRVGMLRHTSPDRRSRPVSPETHHANGKRAGAYRSECGVSTANHPLTGPEERHALTRVCGLPGALLVCLRRVDS